MRIVHPGAQRIREHRHDWPLLTIPALGGYGEECDDDTVQLDGPSAVLHPAGRCHANCIHELGLETFSIEFDPDWLGENTDRLSLDRSRYWRGGEVALAARKLAQLWQRPQASEAELRTATSRFLQGALSHEERPVPAWLCDAQQLIAREDEPSTVDIAQQLRLHPSWFAQAYRLAAGEGLRETLRRRRAERAIHWLRTTDQPVAQIAAAAGFCDQSHLNRVLGRLTGRTPVQIRAERDQLGRMAAA